MSSVNISNLTVCMSDKKLFDNVTFSIPSGKYLLCGENGAGKSTLLRLLCDLVQPNYGSIDVIGEAELVSDSIDIPPEMTVSSVFRLYDKFERCDISLREKLIDEFEFREHTSKTIENLSQGSRQKLRIILAMSGKKTWLLMDEAFNGLDVRSANTLNKLIKSGCRSMILVDHANQCTAEDLVKISIEDAGLCIA